MPTGSRTQVPEAVHGYLLAAGCLVFLLIGAAHGVMQFFGHA